MLKVQDVRMESKYNNKRWNIEINKNNNNNYDRNKKYSKSLKVFEKKSSFSHLSPRLQVRPTNISDDNNNDNDEDEDDDDNDQLK